MKLSLPEKHLEVILEFIVEVEMLQSTLLLQLVLITIPKMQLDVVYELVHVRQRQDLLKTHLDRGRAHTTVIFDMNQISSAKPQLCSDSDGFSVQFGGLTTKISSNSLSSLYLRLRAS